MTLKLSSKPEIDGSGTADKIMKWLDSDTATDSIIEETTGTTIEVEGNVLPGTTELYHLGTPFQQWDTIYAQKMQLYFTGPGNTLQSNGYIVSNGLFNNGGLGAAWDEISTDTELGTDNFFVQADTTSGTVTLTLPNGATTGSGWIVVKWVSGANTLTVEAPVSNSIDGGTFTFTEVGETVQFLFGSSNIWYIVAQTFDVAAASAKSGYLLGADWDSFNEGYTYSQVGHLPLTGGTMTGNIIIDSSADGILTNDGTIKFGGTGGTNNEALTFDFESVADRVTVSSTTGVSDLYWSGFDFRDMGDISFLNGGAALIHNVMVDNIADMSQDETITGTWTFSNVINANGGIAFDTVTDTIAGIENQNLLDKTANETVSGNYTFGADGTGATTIFSSDTAGVQLTWDHDAALSSPLLTLDVEPRRTSYISVTGTDNNPDTISSGFISVTPTFTTGTTGKGSNILYFKNTDSRAISTGSHFARICRGELALSGTISSTGSDDVDVFSASMTEVRSSTGTGAKTRTALEANLGATIISTTNAQTWTYRAVEHSGTLTNINDSTNNANLNVYTTESAFIYSGTWDGTVNVFGHYYHPTMSVAATKEASLYATRSGIILASDGADGTYVGGNIFLGAAEDAQMYYDGTDLIIDPANVGSGILEVQAPVTRQGFFCAYDGTGGVTIPTASSGSITWIDEVRKDGMFTHSASSADITIDVAGDYLVTVDVEADVSDGTRSHVNWWIETDTGGGYSQLAGTQAGTYHRDSNDGKDSASITRIITFAATDKIRVVGQSDRATQITTVADGCRITIERI